MSGPSWQRAEGATSLRSSAPELAETRRDDGPVVGPEAVLRLQRLAGNQAVSAMLGGQADEANHADDSGSVEPGDAVRRALDEPGGSPLDSRVRSLAEPRLGVDLGSTRVKTGPSADAAAKAVGAKLFASGNTIVASQGGYDPASPSGLHDALHETAHIAQQADGPVAGQTTSDGLQISDPSDRFEQAAESFAADASAAHHDGDGHDHAEGGLDEASAELG